MLRYRYLIVGGGMAADAAARGIRELDPSGSIGLVSAEAQPPYARPPLSKALWKGEPRDGVDLGTASHGVQLHLGRRVESLQPGTHLAVDDAGQEYLFDKLLLATGGAPRRLAQDEKGALVYFRTLEDYDRLRALAQPGAPVVVVGGGFIGSEIAAGLALVGARVTMVLPEAGLGERAFGSQLSQHVTSEYRARGVDLLTGDSVRQVSGRDGAVVVTTASGRTLQAVAAVAGLGIEPSVGLASAAGLAVADGILVDAQLRTSHPDVFAAGDVANVFSPALGRRTRVEHEDAAVSMGRAAGRAMAGDESAYTHLPSFYSDLFDMGYEAVGRLDARLDVVGDWREPFREGVQYYLEGGRVRGVLLWNVWGRTDAARELIAAPGPFRLEQLSGRIAA